MPGGRPTKEFDKKSFADLVGFGCSQEEICWFFRDKDTGVPANVDTLSKWCKRTYGMSFQEYKKQDADAIRRGAAKRMGVNAYNARKVEQVDVNGVVIAVFSSLADAARYAGARTQDVYNCCVGRQKSTHGTRWKYAEQDDD